MERAPGWVQVFIGGFAVGWAIRWLSNYSNFATPVPWTDAFSAIGTAAAGVFAFLAFKISQQSLKETQAANHNSLKPILVFESKSTPDKFEIIVKNVGNGPGKIVDLEFRLEVKEVLINNSETLGQYVKSQVGGIIDFKSWQPQYLSAASEFAYISFSVSEFMRSFTEFHLVEPSLNGIALSITYQDMNGAEFYYSVDLETAS